MHISSSFNEMNIFLLWQKIKFISYQFLVCNDVIKNLNYQLFDKIVTQYVSRPTLKKLWEVSGQYGYKCKS